MRTSSVLLLEAQEKERRAIAQDIHDDIGGYLNSLRLLLDMARSETSDVGDDLNEAIEIVDHLIDHVRDLAFRLSPRMLEDLGLVPTISYYAKRFTAWTRIEVTLHNEIDPASRFPKETESTAFRVVQESLTNASKHADASNVQVHLREDRDAVIVHVIDDGKGFDPENESYRDAGMGLRGMKERVELVEGTLEISSAPGAGTRVSASLPK